MHATLGDVVYLLQVAGEKDSAVTIVDVEHLTTDALGLHPGCLRDPVSTAVTRLLKATYPPKEPKAERLYRRYSLTFQSHEAYRADIGERECEIETSERIPFRPAPRKVSTWCVQ